MFENGAPKLFDCARAPQLYPTDQRSLMGEGVVSPELGGAKSMKQILALGATPPYMPAVEYRSVDLTEPTMVPEVWVPWPVCC